MPLNGTPPANLGADRFTDLYSALRAADQLGVQNIGLQPTTPPSDATNAPPRSELIRKTSESLNQLGTAARWAKDVLDSPVTTFVGRNENRLNEYMASGEEAMKQGDYYKAARLFGAASTIDVVNPLPYLDRGHALAAAGDYISAVRNLEQGIRLFPHIAAFKLDLIALVGQKDVFDVRRADLEGRLAGREQYELRFLLGYLELYSGLADEGMKNLRTAAKEAPVESPIASFADLVAGDRKLPNLSK
jgi:tetratricopeptide (TPR) repeat protein